VEKTVILNSTECGYTYFITVGKAIIGCGLYGGVHKLDIKRVLVISDKSRRQCGTFNIFGSNIRDMTYDIDVDIFLTDGSKIEVHSSDRNFLKKLLPYVWELHTDCRTEFYGRNKNKGGRLC